MHDNLDNNIKHRQPTGDEFVDMLNGTRPVGSKTHRDELEKRLLAQLQTNNERNHNMQAVHTGQLISFRKFPAILAATLTFLIIGGALLIFNLENRPPASSSPGQGSATATPIPEDCDVHDLRRVEFHIPVDVYALDDKESDVIGTIDGGAVEIMGANRDGDWVVFIWDDNVVGWIHFAELEKNDYTVQFCPSPATSSVLSELDPTAIPATVAPPTLVPSSTPVTFIDETPLAAPPVLREFIEVMETITVYAKDDEESKELAVLEEGDIVEVIGQNYDGEWLVVRLDAGYVGWISLADGDKYTIKEGLIYSDPDTGDVRELDATASPIPSSTPLEPTVLPPDNQ